MFAVRAGSAGGNAEDDHADRSVTNTHAHTAVDGKAQRKDRLDFLSSRTAKDRRSRKLFP